MATSPNSAESKKSIPSTSISTRSRSNEPRHRSNVTQRRKKSPSEEIWDKLMSNEHSEYAYLFYHAVKKSDAPGYYDIIKRPIDLEEIRKKNRREEYVCLSEFVDDVRLMISNAYLYNYKNDVIIPKVKLFHEVFENELDAIARDAFKDVSKHAREFRNKIDRMGLPSDGDDAQFENWLVKVEDEVRRQRQSLQRRQKIKAKLSESNEPSEEGSESVMKMEGTGDETSSDETRVSSDNNKEDDSVESKPTIESTGSESDKENTPTPTVYESPGRATKRICVPLPMTLVVKPEIPDRSMPSSPTMNSSFSSSPKRRRMTDGPATESPLTIKLPWFTTESKRKLRRDINDLPSERLTNIVEFMLEMNPNLLDSDEVELDLNNLTPKVFWSLRKFVDEMNQQTTRIN